MGELDRPWVLICVVASRGWILTCIHKDLGMKYFWGILQLSEEDLYLVDNCINFFILGGISLDIQS